MSWPPSITHGEPGLIGREEERRRSFAFLDRVSGTAAGQESPEAGSGRDRGRGSGADAYGVPAADGGDGQARKGGWGGQGGGDRQSGNVHVLVIEGHPGSGTSEMLHETLRGARQRGLRTWSAPLGPHGQGLRQWLDQERTLTGPTVLAVDGLPDTADTLPGPVLRAVRELSGRPLALVVTAPAASPLLRERPPFPCRSVDRVELGPLDARAVNELVSSLLGAEPDPDLLDFAAGARGSPRLITSLVEGWSEEGLVQIHEGTARLVGHRLPARLRSTVGAAVARLSGRAQGLLRAAALLGCSFPVRKAREAVGDGVGALSPELNELVAAGVLSVGGGRMEFRQPLFWQAVRDDALETPYGTGPGSQPAEPSGGGAHVVGAVRTLITHGWNDSAITLARGALADSPGPDTAARLRSGLLDALIMSGRPAEAVAVAERALAEPDLPPDTAAALAAGQVVALLASEGANAAQARRAVLGQLRGAAGQDHGNAIALAGLAQIEWADGNFAEALRRGQQAVAAGPALVPSVWRLGPSFVLAMCLVLSGETDEAEAQLRQVDEGIVRHGLTAQTPVAGLIRARLLLRTGRLSGARDAARSALATAIERDVRQTVPFALHLLAMIALRHGDAPQAGAYLTRLGSARPSALGWYRPEHTAWAELQLSAVRHSSPRASRTLAEYAHLLDHRSLLVEEPGAAAWFVRAAHRAGVPDLAVRAVQAAERLAEANPQMPAASVAALHARSLLERDVGGLSRAAAEHQDDWARDCAVRDMAALVGSRLPDPHRADCVEGTRTESMHGVVSARQARQGAHGDSGDGHARGIGVHPSPHPLEALSESERAIARLVSEGLTNRQIAGQMFLSPHTINYYLRKIYRKLGVRSRVALAVHVHGTSDEAVAPTVRAAQSGPAEPTGRKVS